MSRAFGSVQGPAASLNATKAPANLLTNLLGPAQRGDARSPANLESAGEMAAGRDGAQGSHRAILTGRKSCFLQANTCSTSAFLSVKGCCCWLNLPEKTRTSSLSKTQVLIDLGPLHLTWHNKKLTDGNGLTRSCSYLNFSQCAGLLRSRTALIFYLHMSEEDAKPFSMSTVEVCRSY